MTEPWRVRGDGVVRSKRPVHRVCGCSEVLNVHGMNEVRGVEFPSHLKVLSTQSNSGWKKAVVDTL